MMATDQVSSATAADSVRRVTWPARLWITLTLGGVIAFMLWTASSSNNRFFTAPVQESDYFNVLARGFRAGKLGLNVEGPPALRQLADPYDPKQRGELGMHDASYYKGQYYLYFGPAPVVTLMLPFQLITGRDLQLGWVTAFYAILGYGALAAVLISTWRRYFPYIGTAPICTALLVLGLCTMVTSDLRRSHIWEMPIAAGFGFAAASIAAMYAALHRPKHTLWFTITGLLLGLAIASRVVYVVGTAMPAAALAWWWLIGRRQGRWRIWPDRTWWRPALGCGAAIGSIVCLLLLYNYLRFENPLEFGMRYQLTAVYEMNVRHFSLGYWWNNFRIYFFNLARWSATYPYVLPGTPPSPGPSGYLYSEWVTAMLPNMPFYALAIAAPLALRRQRDRAFTAWVLGLIAFAVAVSALLLGFVSSADRYMVDFLPSWALLAGLGLFAVETQLMSRRWLRLMVRTLWVGAAAISVMVGVIASIESQGVFPHAAPKQYRRVTQLLTSPVRWLETRHDDPTLLLLPPGAMAREWSVELRPNLELAQWHDRCFPFVVAGRYEVADTLVLLVTGDQTVRLGYDHWGDGRVLSPPFEVNGRGTVTWRVTYSAVDESNRDHAYRWLTVTADGREVWRVRVACYGTLLDRVRIGENDIGATTCEKAFPSLIPARVVSPLPPRSG
jgi:hypothetical protein